MEHLTPAEIALEIAQRQMWYRQDQYQEQPSQFRKEQMLEAERHYLDMWRRFFGSPF